ncbi:50S ribosomal protein L4 [Candidatus Roizmanbacteria bacterium]|nr:50S ribosomal protein L4 [Candidatus Roizmanbacteria bacterium]
MATKTEKKIETKKVTVKKIESLTVQVYDMNGKEKGTLSLPKEIFSVVVKPQLLAQAVRVYQFNQRQGTASAKTRGEVIGSTRKIYRQKGTGRARHGSIKAPIFVGGGVVGGPRPKDYTLKINKKQKTKAFFGALSLKLKEKSVLGLDDKALNIEPKTKLIADFLKNMELSNKKVVFVLPKLENNNFILATRNLKKVSFTDAKSLNVFQILNSSKLVFLESSLEVLKNHFLKNEN